MADYDKLVQKSLKQLESPSARDRRTAAAMLGELASAEGIAPLVRLYRNDDDAGVRRAAAYALGQFRAVQDALQRGEEERVAALLGPIEADGKVGRRARVPRALVALFALLLLLAFGGLVAANAALLTDTFTSAPRVPAWAEDGVAWVQQRMVPPTPNRRPLDMLDIARSRTVALRNNATTLEAQYTPVLGGAGPTACDAFYNTQLTPLEITTGERSAFPDLGRVYDRLNDGLAALNTAKTQIEPVCFDGASMTPVEADAAYRPVANLTRDLPVIVSDLDAALRVYLPPEPTPRPPGATPEFALPTPTPVNLREHVATLFGIIDAVTRPGGAQVRLDVLARDVQAGNADRSCREPRPAIPPNYNLPPDAAGQSFELSEAARRINLGLDALRAGWGQFDLGCQTSGGFGSVERSATAAGEAFTNAADLLRRVDAQLRNLQPTATPGT